MPNKAYNKKERDTTTENQIASSSNYYMALSRETNKAHKLHSPSRPSFRVCTYIYIYIQIPLVELIHLVLLACKVTNLTNRQFECLSRCCGVLCYTSLSRSSSATDWLCLLIASRLCNTARFFDVAGLQRYRYLTFSASSSVKVVFHRMEKPNSGTHVRIMPNESLIHPCSW